MRALWNRLANLKISNLLELPSGRTFGMSRLVSVTASAITLNARDHGERPIVLDRAAGIAVTLPAATGSGVEFDIIVGTTITSNSTTVKVANSTDVMNGSALQSQDAGATLQMFEAASTDDTITFNGTTTGGIIGDRIKLVDIKPGFWAVQIIGQATDSEATPFSATV